MEKKTLLCLATGMGYPVSTEEQIPMIGKAGFDGFFTGWGFGCPVAEWARIGRECGMFYQSIHAPFTRANKMWQTGAEGDDVVAELCACLDDCAENGVPLMVAHAFIGFLDHTPTEIGAQRFAKVGEHAKEVGVKLALENTEGEEYLAAAMEAAAGNPNVGFCLDTGHEMCYNRSKDMLALYGDRVIATHFNDNVGITGDEITWLDDAHLLPFDGIADWENIVARLDAHGYDGPYTFELTVLNKPDRHTHDRYAGWDFERYLAEAYQRAQRVLALHRG